MLVATPRSASKAQVGHPDTRRTNRPKGGDASATLDLDSIYRHVAKQQTRESQKLVEKSVGVRFPSCRPLLGQLEQVISNLLRHPFPGALIHEHRTVSIRTGFASRANCRPGAVGW